MFHFFSFAARIFIKDKFFSLLNILGLGFCIAVALLLVMILEHDLSFDKHHVRHKNIYRLGAYEKIQDGEFQGAITARELGPLLQQEFSEIEQVARIEPWGRTLVKREMLSSLQYYEDGLAKADSSYFKVFSHRFIAGDEATCLREPHSIVLTQTMARKYFGEEDPLNQVVIIEGDTWKVTAIIEDVPNSSHFKFGGLLSIIDKRAWENPAEAYWNPDVYTYLLVGNGFNPKAFADKFPPVYDKYLKSIGDKINGKFSIILEPLADIHFHSSLESDLPRGNLSYLVAFSVIGVFVIILACINYMNLATAKSITRAKEVAVRKVLGSPKLALVISFLSESIILSFTSLLLSICMLFAILSLTSFNNLIGKDLQLNVIQHPILAISIFIVPLLIGVISGLYPAIFLTSINEMKALKGAFKNKRSSLILRKVLITVQFSVSIFVAASVLLMKHQIDFIRSQDLGFNKHNVLILPVLDEKAKQQVASFKEILLQNPNVNSVTTSTSVVGMKATIENYIMWAEGDSGMKLQNFAVFFVGEEYLKTMGIELIEGNDFTAGSGADIENEFIANETASKAMGWQKDPINKKIRFYQATMDAKIVGIVKDFKFISLHNPVEPLVIRRAPDAGYVYVHIDANIPQAIEYIKSKWSQFDSSHPFEYFFLDDRFNEQYKDDETQNKLLTGLAYVCIFISLLGLIGLSAFSATQRTKEIGVRKILGAPTVSLVFLMYKEIMVLVVIAFIISIPCAHYVVVKWLENFAFTAEINYILYVLVGILALLFSFTVVMIYSLRTSQTNPIKSLRYE
jgi:putative ABC transport system permease protein